MTFEQILILLIKTNSMSIRIEFQYEKEKLDKIVVDACD